MKSNVTVSIDVDILKKAKRKIENMSLFVEDALKKEIGEE